jgi:hypothetical protein
MTTGLPQGFREGHAGDLACPHRDLTTCSACQAEHAEIAILGGQAFWIANPAERAESLALEKARIEKNYSEKQISLFK